MITLAEAKKLQYGDILHDERGKRWKVTGMVKLWKRPDPYTGRERIRVPLKHGLYSHDYIDGNDFDDNGVCNLLTKGEPK